jgi:hypothetical protein
MMRAKLLVVFQDWFNHALMERKLPEGWCRMDSGFFSVVVAICNGEPVGQEHRMMLVESLLVVDETEKNKCILDL